MHNDDSVENALENKNCSFLFVLHGEFFCLKDVVDLKVLNFSSESVCTYLVRILL